MDSKFCISSPMPVKMISFFKKNKKLPEMRLGERYQAELPAQLSEEVRRFLPRNHYLSPRALSFPSSGGTKPP